MAARANKVETNEPPVTKEKINIEAINKTIVLTPRIKAIKDRYLQEVSKVSSDRPWYMVESRKQTVDQHPAVRQAKALANVWDKKAINIFDYDLIVGNMTDAVRGAHPLLEMYPSGMKMLCETQQANWTNSAAVRASLSKEDSEKLLECAIWWEDNFLTTEGKKHWERLYNEVLPDDWVRESRYCGVNWAPEFFPKGQRLPWFPETVLQRPQAPCADFAKVLKVGYKGLIKEAKDHIERIKDGARGRDFFDEEKEKLAVLESITIALEGATRYAKRYAALAWEMAAKEQNTQRKGELEKVAEACTWVPENPARTFQEALQSVQLTALGVYMDKCQPNMFMARMDQYLFPYYMADINEGRITRQEAMELLSCLIFKLTEVEPYMTPEHRAVSQGTNYENITIGGVDVNGRDASNELSCMILHAAQNIKAHQPYVSLRYHNNMAPELLDKAFECARVHGAGVPAFFNDRVNIEYMLSRGHTLEEARDNAIAGCINVVYPKKFGWMRNVPSTNNEAKMLELVLHNGTDPRTGIAIGLETGDPRDFKTFEELKEAFKKQMTHIIGKQIDINNRLEKELFDYNFYFPFISAVLEGCIENGRDIVRMFGIDDAPYGLDRFFQDVTDSLIAVKKLVFEQKKYTMDQIIEACNANWEGHERVRADCLAQPKYGNDDDEADQLMNELWTCCTDFYMKRKDIWGRHYIVYRQGSSVAAQAGKLTGALPNGRKAGEWLADAGLSPVQQADRKGPTAVINSVTKIDVSHMDGTLLNMKICPSLVDKPSGMMKFKQLVRTFMDKGGQEIQFNILDKDMLLDAQKDPQNYRDLVVRVAGYSAFWVDLEEQVQEEIIRRTEHAI